MMHRVLYTFLLLFTFHAIIGSDSSEELLQIKIRTYAYEFVIKLHNNYQTKQRIVYIDGQYRIRDTLNVSAEINSSDSNALYDLINLLYLNTSKFEEYESDKISISQPLQIHLVNHFSGTRYDIEDISGIYNCGNENNVISLLVMTICEIGIPICTRQEHFEIPEWLNDSK